MTRRKPAGRQLIVVRRTNAVHYLNAVTDGSFIYGRYFSKEWYD